MTVHLSRLATLVTLIPLSAYAGNPIITDVFTADPAALVQGDTVYLYTGHDEAKPNEGYTMRDWLVFSSKDMKTWTPHGAKLKVGDFKWAKADAWASHVAEKDGKFYWYVAVEHDNSRPGKAIGVAVGDSPTGPFKDAIGAALITAQMTPKGKISWEDIDPAIFTDSDGTSYIYWGNVRCYVAKLKPNMIELDGPIMDVEVPNFTEAPYLHKRGDVYYLTYATSFPEKVAYATAPSPTGPWTPRGLLAEVAGNSNTIHQSIIEFKSRWYFIYHNGAVPAPNTGGSFRRSVCIDYLYFNADGTMKSVVQTSEGLDAPPQDDDQKVSALPTTAPARP